MHFRCSFSNVEDFKLGKIPIQPPSEAYKKTLLRGIIEGEILSEADALQYLHDAIVRPL